MLTPTQIEIYEILQRIILENRFPLIIEGNPGCGKTTLAKELKEKGKKYPIIYINNRSFGQINFWRESVSSVEEPLNNLHLSLPIFKRTLKFSISIFFWFQTKIHRKKILRDQLTVETYTSLFLLNKYLKRKPNAIIVLDELNFWNDSHLKIVYRLLFSDTYKQAFRFLGNVKVILLYSKGYYISELLSTILKESGFEHLHMNNYTDEDVEYLVPDMTTRELTLDNMSSIKQLSLESNISILLAVIEYIKKNKSKPSIQGIIGDIEAIIDKYFYNELNIHEVLKSAAISFEQTTLEEIIHLSEKIYDLTPETTKTLVLRLLLKKILQSNSEILIDNTSVVQFIHQDYREYFKPKTEKEIMIFFSSYAKVLQIISPGDYLERSESYRYALEMDKYYLYQTMYAIQNFLTESKLTLCIKQNSHKIFIEKMQIAYDYFNHQKSKLALLQLEEIDNMALPSLLLFEKDFLKLKMKMERGDKILFEHIIHVMNQYCNEFEGEKEVVVRANMLLYLAYLYLGKNTEMEKANQVMIQEINKLSKNNDKFQYYLYSLYRRSLMVKSIEVAYNDTLLCIQYFQKKNIEDYILYRRELFYSLINHADNCRYLDNHSEAYECICRANRIYERYSVGLPNITLNNNFAVISYENSQQTAEKSIKQLEDLVQYVDIKVSVESTYYIIYNNIACIYAMEDKFEEALNNINKAFKIINNIENKISNHCFNLLTNKSVILLLMGRKNEALDNIDKAKHLFTYHFSSESNRRRYNVINEIIQNDNIFSSFSDLFSFIENEYPPTKHLNQPLRLWCMQYWSK